MRRKGRPPRNKKYFHTKRKIDKQDIIHIKKKFHIIKQKKLRKEAEKHKKNFWRFK